MQDKRQKVLPKIQRIEAPKMMRGDLYYADLSPVIGSEQGGVRPVVVIQNDVGNRFSPTTIVAAITSVRHKTALPTHVRVDSQISGLPKESVVLMEQIRTIDKKRLKEKIGHLNGEAMQRIDAALMISIGLQPSGGTDE